MATASDSPLLEPRAPGSPSEADYVLLTTASAAPGEEEEAPAAAAAAAPHFKPVERPTLPRPRFLPLLQLAALLDLAAALFLGFRVPVWTLPASTVVVNLAKPVVVGAAVSSSKVREHGPIILAQLALSALVLLFRLNEIVQTSDHRTPGGTGSSSDHLGLLNPTSEWYLASFCFSLLHYLLFATLVGFRRARNPLAGRMRRSSTWGEQRWEGTQETVPAAEAGHAGSVRSRSSAGQGSSSLDGPFRSEGGDYGSDLEVDELERSDEGDDASATSSEDEDDIVDVPRRYRGAGLTASTSGALRNRASRSSLLSTATSARTDDFMNTSPRKRLTGGRGLVRDYGSINSLAGI